ncbi:MAG: efflux RND transporter periplasmic adaptor subunit [Planctomycetota bacterium]
MQTHAHLLLTTCFLLPACSKKPPAAPRAMPPLPVEVATIAAQQVPITFEYLGRTEGSREVEIRARTSGFLESRHFVEGSDVGAGDLLFQLDARPLIAQEASAAAEVATAAARVAQTERERERVQPLVAEQAVSQREADDAVSAASIAAAELTAAEARLEQIRVDLSYTKVTAPIAGRIGRALRAEGSLVSPTGDGLLTTLVQLDPIYVAFHRTEAQQHELARELENGRLVLPTDGQFVVELQNRDGSMLAGGGKIDFRSAQLDTRTGTIPMRATLPNPSHGVLAGQSVKVVLRGAVLANAITVPQRAVLESPQGKIVMLAVTGGNGATVAESRPVEVGEWVDLPGKGPAARAWVVTKGLAAGDRVILDNLMRLRPGSAVLLQDPPASPATSAPQSTGR